MSKFKLMTEEQKEAIEWLRVQKEFLSDNKRDIFISESGNYPIIDKISIFDYYYFN